MSAQGIIDLSIPPNGKIYDTYLPNPYPYPAFPSTLAQTLFAGDDGGNQDMINIANIEVNTSIKAPLIEQSLLGGSLTIGGGGDDLRIQGATLKGSILAGDGTNTIGLPVGANGLVLTTNSAQATGLEWAVGGGGGGVASVVAGLNIGITGTAANPIVGVLDPLTSVLNIATQNITGTTSAILQTDINVALSQSQLDAGGLDVFSTAAPANQINITYNGVSVQAAGSGDTMVLGPVSLSKTFGTTAMLIADTVAGQNIDIQTATTGIITTNCAIKPTAIRDSASSDGTSGQYLTAGAGASTLWTTLPANVASVSAGLNIGITGTSTAPIVGLLNPLTSTLGLGTQSVTGTSASMSLVNAGSTNTTSSVQVRIADTTTATTAAVLTKSSLVVNVSTPTANAITYGSAAIAKTGVNSFTISNASNSTIIGGIGVSLDPAGGAVSVSQTALTATRLRTNLSNHYYYPDYYADNQNTSGPIVVPFPQVTNQRMTLANYGVVQNNTWVAMGDNINGPASGVASFYQDSQGRVWVSGVGGGEISIRDNNNTAPDLQTITLAGGGTNEAYCYYEDNNFMFIGGDFRIVDGSPQQQYCLTRFDMTTFPYTFSPMFDTTGIEGFDAPVYTISSALSTGFLYVGGGFLNTAPSSIVVDCLAIIGNPYTAPGSQTYNMFLGGANNKVNTMYWDPNSNYLHIGGDFTAVNASSQPLNYGAYIDLGSSTWFDVGSNAFNSIVMSIVPATAYGKMFYAGGFTNAPQQYNCYIDEFAPFNAPEDTGLTGMTPFIYRNCVYSQPSGNLAVLNNGVGVYVNQSQLVWIDNANPTTFGATGDTSGLDLWDGDYKVGYTTTTKLYDQVILPDSCEFLGGGGTFKHLGTLYVKFTLPLTDIAQQFVGDPTNNYWVPIGGVVGTFS